MSDWVRGIVMMLMMAASALVFLWIFDWTRRNAERRFQ